VVEAVQQASGQKFAVKMINKQLMRECDAEALATEISIMKKVNHPNILAYVDCYETTQTTFLVLEL